MALVPDDFDVVEMTDAFALQLSTWRYPGDLSNNDRDDDDVTFVMDPANGYRALAKDGVLFGYCNFGPDARVPGGSYDEAAVDVGIGLAPELVGRGKGHAALAATLQYAAESFPGRPQRATIAVTNAASRRVFERAGFTETHRFTAPTGVVYSTYERRSRPSDRTT